MLAVSDRDTLVFDNQSVVISTQHGNENKTIFFTPTDIYSPGQTIFFTGFECQTDEVGRLSKVIQNKKFLVALENIAGEKIKETYAFSDRNGAFRGSFKIPANCPKGDYTINGGAGKLKVQVLSVQTGDLFLDIEPSRKFVYPGDLVGCKGTLRTYSGKIIEGATVQYKVIRSLRTVNNLSLSPEISASLVVADTEVAQGIAQTDKDGKFSFSFRTIKKLIATPYTDPEYTYAIFTSATGQDDIAVRHKCDVISSSSAVRLHCTINHNKEMAGNDTFFLESNDPMGQPLNVPVRVRIEKLSNPGHVWRSRLWKFPDKFLYDSVAYRKYFPLDEYQHESDPDFWSTESIIFDTLLQSANGQFVVLPIGIEMHNACYNVKISATDSKGKPTVINKFWSVYNSTDSLPLFLPITASEITDKKYRVGDSVATKLATAFDSSRLLIVERNLESGSARFLTTKIGSQTWQHHFSEDDAGGFSVSLSTLKDNRLYSKDVKIKVEKPGSELKLKSTYVPDTLRKEMFGLLGLCVARDGQIDSTTTVEIAAIPDAGTSRTTTLVSNFVDLPMPVIGWVSGKLLGAANPEIQILQDDFDIRTSQRFMPEISLSGNSVREVHTEPTVSVHLVQAKDKKSAHKRHIFKKADRTRLLAQVHENQSAGSAFPTASFQASEQRFENLTSFQSPSDVENHKNIYKFQKQAISSVSDSVQPLVWRNVSRDTTGTRWYQCNVEPQTPDQYIQVVASTQDAVIASTIMQVKVPSKIVLDLICTSEARLGDTVSFIGKIKNQSDSVLVVTPDFQIRYADQLTPGFAGMVVHFNSHPISIPAGKSDTVQSWFVVPLADAQSIQVDFKASSTNTEDHVARSVNIEAGRDLYKRSALFTLKASNDAELMEIKGLDEQVDFGHLPGPVCYKFVATGDPVWILLNSLQDILKQPCQNAVELAGQYAVLSKLQQWAQSHDEVEGIGRRERNSLFDDYTTQVPEVLNFRNGTIQQNDLTERLTHLILSDRIDARLHFIAGSLKKLQSESGEFSWLPGMDPDAEITLDVLQYLGSVNLSNHGSDVLVESMLRKTASAMDHAILKKDHVAKLDSKPVLSVPDFLDIRYAYIRTLFPTVPISAALGRAFDHILDQEVKQDYARGLLRDAMVALLSARRGDTATAGNIANRLRGKLSGVIKVGGLPVSVEDSLLSSTQGEAIWRVVMAALNSVSKDSAFTDQYEKRLLKSLLQSKGLDNQKLIKNWFLFFNCGGTTLGYQPSFGVVENGMTSMSRRDSKKTDFGISLFSIRFDSSQSAASSSTLSLKTKSGQSLYGLLTPLIAPPHLTYENDTTTLKIVRQFLLPGISKAQALQPIDLNINNLKPGDRIVVRLQIEVKKETDFVSLSNQLPAGLEIHSLFSGFRNVGGVGYFECRTEQGVTFYLNHLQKGIYSFDYSLYVTPSGTYQLPPCMVNDLRTSRILSATPVNLIHIGKQFE